MKIILFLFPALFLFACSQPGADRLPILGERDVVNGDTVYHRIPPFAFINQDSQLVNNQTFSGKAYVVDFFFTRCPSICPKVKKQMLRVHDRFAAEDRLLFLSHTIDVKHDTLPVLQAYAQSLGVSSAKWHFVVGSQDSIYQIADDYFSIATVNPDAPGGFDHSGRLILVDPDGYVRSFCDGTDPASVDRFMDDIDLLMAELSEKAPK